MKLASPLSLRVVHADEGGSAGPTEEGSTLAPPHVQAARQFAAARAALGWSQDRVAIRLGVARRTVVRWELGQTEVPGWAIVALEQRRAA